MTCSSVNVANQEMHDSEQNDSDREIGGVREGGYHHPTGIHFRAAALRSRQGV